MVATETFQATDTSQMTLDEFLAAMSQLTIDDIPIEIEEVDDTERYRY